MTNTPTSPEIPASSRPTALVTGATAGIGAEFVRQLAADEYDLVLVARNVDRLAATAARLREQFGTRVEVVPADLETDDGVASVCARLADRGRPVTMLVNNAGYGLGKPFEEHSVARERAQLRILVQTPMELMHAALEPMLARGQGRIINVASMAGFVPRGTYGASKAWLISFSRWANARYGPRGVGVTALCPGFVHTEFHQRMGVSTARIPGWMWLNAERVVREGLTASVAGKAVCVPSRRYAIGAGLTRVAPVSWTAAVANRGR